MTNEFLWGFPSFFFVSGAVDIAETDTAVALHLVGMPVPSPHPTPYQPRGGQRALLLWLPVHSSCCPSIAAPEQL